MVEIKDEEFNHVYKISNKDGDIVGYNASLTELTTVKIPSGGTVAYFKGEIELFEKSQALTSGIEKLPFVRDIDTIVQIDGFMGEMDAANATWVSCQCSVFVGEKDPDEAYDFKDGDMIYTKNKQWSTNAAAIASITACHVEEDGGMIPKQSSILAGNKLTFVGTIATGAAAAADLTIDHVCLMVEIDWKPITKKQLQEYVTEYIFARKTD